MIRGIEAQDAENEARDEARINAAIARGKAKGEADAKNDAASAAASKPAAGTGAAATEEEKKDNDEKYPNIDPAIIKSIEETILDSSPNVKWDDVKGLSEVKQIL